MGIVKNLINTRGWILILISTFIWGASCSPEVKKSQLQLLEAELESLRQEPIQDPLAEAQLKQKLAKAYIEAVEKDSAGIDPATYLFKAADLYEGMASYSKKALGLYQELLRSYPDHPLGAESAFRRGWIYANLLQDTVNAERALAQFVRLYPDHELVPNVPTELVQLGMSPDEAYRFLENSLSYDTLSTDTTDLEQEATP